jgi:ribosomal protein L11 methyltransferase (prmA)
MAHYFENDDTLKSKERQILVKINNINFSFLTDYGVFSKNGLDFGTRTLLETLDTSKISGKVLDFGCGYGPIGIYIAKTTNSEVHMIDINRRVLGLARKNVSLNHVNVNIYESNIYEKVTEQFDYIISNPPIRVGKEILYKILFEAKEHLKENGELWIVVNKDQGAKSLVKDLEKEYSVEIKNKKKGFYIIQCLKTKK